VSVALLNWLTNNVQYDEQSGVCTWLTSNKVTGKGGKYHMPGDRFGYIDSRHGYWVVGLKSYGFPHMHQVHRLIWLMKTGELPTCMIDHINHDRADNTWVNLREATASQNQMNRSIHKSTTTGYRGILIDHYNKQNIPYYMASVRADGKSNRKGSYNLEELVLWCRQERMSKHQQFAHEK
jgi:hypothetical protein